MPDRLLDTRLVEMIPSFLACCRVLPSVLRRASAGVDVLVHEAYPAVRLKPEPRPGGEDWPRYMHAYHTSDEELGALAASAQPKLLVLSHLVRMGGSDEELLAGIRKGGFTGRAAVGKDLDRY